MKRHGLVLFLAALLVLPFFAATVTSCAKQQVKKEVGLSDEEKARLEAERLAREKAAREEEARRRQLEQEQQRMAAERAALEAFLNEHAHFDFDKYNIRPDAEVVLKAKAGYLNTHPNVTVEIQGHCDERGTEAYNMALGDRRAKSAQNFLESLGIAGSRMSTVSYGEDRPLCNEKNEDCWQQNRRAQFVVIGR